LHVVSVRDTEEDKGCTKAEDHAKHGQDHH
jgi:hypothetical protein